MGLTVADAYAQIKNLENSGQISLPEPQGTVVMGTIDPKVGTFKWTAPTVVQTIVEPLEPGQKTSTITKVTAGVIKTDAVDLRLKFDVIPLKIVDGNASIARDAKLTSGVEPVATAVGSGVSGESNGGVTISGFPTVTSTATEIIVDAGFALSVALDARNITPPVSTILLNIAIPGHETITLRFFVLRPPVLGMGAFTIEALPMTIVYAPPQGKLAQNTATYSDTQTMTRSVTTGVNNSTSTKTVQAYTPGDLIAKVAGAIAAVAAVVGTGGGAAAGPSVAGAFSDLGSALFGAAKDDSDSVADTTKGLSDTLGLFSTVMNGVDVAITSQQGGVSTETDNTLTLTTSTMDQWSADAGFGPGVGDRIVYLHNMKVAWVAVNGQVGISILGFDGFGANAVQDLVQEQALLTAGGQPRLGLSAAAIASLLSQDPLAPGKPQNIDSRFAPPLIGPPRFVPANPSGHNGSGTGATGTGDIIQASYETLADTKTITTSNQTTITDAKPGWLDVVFGSEGNTDTTTTGSMTVTQTVDNSADDKMVSIITMFSEGTDDPYDIRIFYDFTFGTYVIVNADSPALRGGIGILGGIPTQLAPH